MAPNPRVSREHGNKVVLVLPWTLNFALLVHDVLAANLHTLGDPAIIQLIGKEDFIDACINGPGGWQKNICDIEGRKVVIYCSTVSHNRKALVVLYLVGRV